MKKIKHFFFCLWFDLKTYKPVRHRLYTFLAMTTTAIVLGLILSTGWLATTLVSLAIIGCWIHEYIKYTKPLIDSEVTAYVNTVLSAIDKGNN